MRKSPSFFSRSCFTPFWSLFFPITTDHFEDYIRHKILSTHSDSTFSICKSETSIHNLSWYVFHAVYSYIQPILTINLEQSYLSKKMRKYLHKTCQKVWADRLLRQNISRLIKKFLKEFHLLDNAQNLSLQITPIIIILDPVTTMCNLYKKHTCN